MSPLINFVYGFDQGDFKLIFIGPSVFYDSSSLNQRVGKYLLFKGVNPGGKDLSINMLIDMQMV